MIVSTGEVFTTQHLFMSTGHDNIRGSNSLPSSNCAWVALDKDTEGHILAPRGIIVACVLQIKITFNTTCQLPFHMPGQSFLSLSNKGMQIKNSLIRN